MLKYNLISSAMLKFLTKILIKIFLLLIVLFLGLNKKENKKDNLFLDKTNHCILLFLKPSPLRRGQGEVVNSRFKYKRQLLFKTTAFYLLCVYLVLKKNLQFQNQYVFLIKI